MARNSDTRVGCVRAQVASSLGCPFWVPSSLSVPHSHPQGPWKSGRPSPSTLAATPARPATLQAWPTSTWSSLCKVSIPGPDSRALEAGSRWRARGFSGRKDSACLRPPFRGFRSPLFPLEASLSGAQTSPPRLEVSPGTSAALFLCSLPRGEATAQCGLGGGQGGGAAALRGLGHPSAEHRLAEGRAQCACR